MSVNVIKVSQFPTVGSLEAGDLITGLRAGANTNFTGEQGSLIWQPVNGLTEQMAPNNGYVTMNAGVVNLLLPLEAAFGDLIGVVGWGSGGWTISQNEGQQIFLGLTPTTPGVGGSLSSTQSRDSIVLMCVVPNVSFINLGAPQGNITYI